MYAFRKRPEGHGICGSKNIYSSNVKIGNWNEDLFGEYLVSHRNGNVSLSKPWNEHQPQSIDDEIIELQPSQIEVVNEKDTVHRTSFPPIALRPNPPPMPIKVQKPFELLMKNKMGTLQNVIYNDGTKGMPAEDRFTTVSHLTYGGSESLKQYAVPPRTLEKIKREQFKNDIDLAFTGNMSTELRSATKLRNNFRSKPLSEIYHVGDVQMPDCKLRKAKSQLVLY